MKSFCYFINIFIKKKNHAMILFSLNFEFKSFDQIFPARTRLRINRALISSGSVGMIIRSPISISPVSLLKEISKSTLDVYLAHKLEENSKISYTIILLLIASLLVIPIQPEKVKNLFK